MQSYLDKPEKKPEKMQFKKHFLNVQFGLCKKITFNHYDAHLKKLHKNAFYGKMHFQTDAIFK